MSAFIAAAGCGIAAVAQAAVGNVLAAVLFAVSTVIWLAVAAQS